MAAVAFALVLAGPAAAQQPAPPQQVITSSGPLTSIYLQNDLACQVQAAGDGGPSFFGGTNPGACGTFVAFPQQGPTSAAQLDGPTGLPASGLSPTPYPAGSQTPVTGNGSAANPFTVTTIVDATAPDANGAQQPTLQISETDTYVTGQDSYHTTLSLSNITASQFLLTGTIYHAGDCFLANQDTGFGAFDSPTGSPQCTINANNSPPARLMGFTPVATSPPQIGPAHYYESRFSNVWGNISSAAAQFPDSVEATTNQDNGMGLSWAFSLPNKAPKVLQFSTTISPSNAPLSSTSASGCLANDQLPVSVSAVDGAQQVNYIDNGGSQNSAFTDSNGNASISLAPGPHTVEFWGQDKSGHQESPHHVITITAGCPSVSVSNATVNRSATGPSTARFAVSLSAPVVAPVSINYQTVDGSARAGRDYAATRGTLVIAPGQTVGTITVPVIDSAKRGTALRFGLNLTSASNALLGPGGVLGTATILPAPVFGKTVNLGLVSGVVFVKLSGHAASASQSGGGEPGSLSGLGASALGAGAPLAGVAVAQPAGYIPLLQARQVPVGSTIDAIGGVASLTSATSARGKLQSGDFGAGLFKILQNRRQRGLTQLNLVDAGNARKVCAAAGKAQAARRLSSRVLGLLNSRASGRFSTRGRYSAATVRGTVWSTADRCNGTLTHVTRGVVVVRDFRRRLNITLRAGHSYLAKAPGA